MLSAPISKSSVMTLFLEEDEIYSHVVRLVLAEKEVPAEFEFINMKKPPQKLFEYNAYGTSPTLIDRDLVLYDANIIIEYLDERYPHPPLLPVYPIARANSRLLIYRIQKDWYSLYDKIIAKPYSKEAEEARNSLRDGISSIAPIFKEYGYFMSDEFSLIDCYLAVLLWRFPEIKITLPATIEKQLSKYFSRLFERPTFLESLTNVEKNKRGWL